MTDAEREIYSDVADPHALIAYTDDETWIIEGDMLRIVHIDQHKLEVQEQVYSLELWGTPFRDVPMLE